MSRRAKLTTTAAAVLALASLCVADAPLPKKTAAHNKTVHSRESSKASHRAGKKSRRRPKGQQAIDTQRAREIQEALIREHYLSGEPSGTWDTSTQSAMRRYQTDQGWQDKVVPDSRALIRLGLGPDHEHLLNPESAMITGPRSRVEARSATTGTSVPPSGTTATPASAAPAATDLAPSR